MKDKLKGVTDKELIRELVVRKGTFDTIADAEEFIDRVNDIMWANIETNESVE